jgi:ABC-type transporter Mla subunit MlaD
MTIFAYALAINDAVRRGDPARLRQLLDVARQAHQEQGGDLSKAIKAGESALKKLAKGRK